MTSDRRVDREDTPLIVAAEPLTGHTRPMLSIARGLVAAGRSVTFLGGSRFADAARSTGARFVALSGSADFDDRRLAEDHPELFSRPPGGAQMDYLYRWSGDMAVDQNADLQRLLRELPGATVLHDMGFFGSWPQLLGAPGIRARTMTIGNLPIVLGGQEITFLGPLTPAPGLDLRAATAQANAEFDAAMAGATEHVDGVMARTGATARLPASVTAAVYLLPDVFAQLTVPTFEYPRADGPRSLHLVGALPAEPVAGWTPPSWWSELAERRVVVVTQGTLANHDVGELVQPTLDALADTDVLVVAALGREPRPGELRVPPNARVEAFVPFDELFPHTDVLVTSGGYGSTQLALAHGIPLVVAGEREDKPMVAARVAHFGVGLDLRSGRPAAAQVGAAVHKVLEDPTFLERAATLKDDYRRYDPVAAILELADGTSH